MPGRIRATLIHTNRCSRVAHSFFCRHNVTIVDVDTSSAAKFSEWATSSGFNKLLFIEGDVSSEQVISSVVSRTLSHFDVPSVNVLVNNAAIANPYYKYDKNVVDDKPAIVGLELDEWMRYINVNLTSAFLAAKHVLPVMNGPGSKAIVNIASTRALMSEPNSEAYAATKGGLLGFSHALAISAGKMGVRVNAVIPGWIDTTGDDEFHSSSELRSVDHEQHPVGRVGVPNDIAEMVYFLADDAKSGFITGQEFVVDGGMTRKMIYEE